MAGRDTPLKPEIFEILAALDAGPLHGWGIVGAVEEATGGAVRLAPSLLYRRLRTLLSEGLVEEAGEAPGERGPPRRRYALTARGRELARAEARRLLAVARSGRVRRLAGGGPL